MKEEKKEKRKIRNKSRRAEKKSGRAMNGNLGEKNMEKEFCCTFHLYRLSVQWLMHNKIRSKIVREDEIEDKGG